ncbi:MAG: hypothetical protein EG828_05235 [Deltaproteobacteria bacterium]|nr:hypothetical protein [Deltaproteobacteria bacterium]
MKWILVASLALATCFSSAGSWAADAQSRQLQITGEARRGFEEILDIWRQESFDELYDRLVPDAGSDRWDFVDQLNHSARRPACCWKKIADVTVVYLDDTAVLLTARLGIEVVGFGTRFVTRTFRLVKESGVWRLPESDILSLAEPNMQRIPREILEKPY